MYMYILTIILIVFIVLGLFISKEFRYGFITTIGSVIVFSPVIVIGLVYSLPYSIFMSFKERDWTVFFKIW